ncbi:hypothetical protein KI387_020452, partial [Taxus chinensis]
EKKAGGTSSSPVSLLEFLDKKLDKRSQKTLEGKSCDDVSAIPRVLGRGTSHGQTNTSTGIALSMFQQLNHSSKHPQQEVTKAQDEGATSVHDPTGKRTSLKRKNFSSPDDFRESFSGRLLVLGDDPKPKKKLHVPKGFNERPHTIFNHYADGGGWWDTDMVGLDSDEVGTTEIWEGMGSTTIGGL